MGADVLFFLVCFGIANAICFLHIFHWLRAAVSGMTDREFINLAKMRRLVGFRQRLIGRGVRCHACVGFWVGATLSLIRDSGTTIGMGKLALDVFQHAFASSAVCFVTWVVLRKLGAEEM